MENCTPHLDTLLELESRHEALLHHLDELDKRVEQALQQYQAGQRQESADRGEPTGQLPPN